jgi:hypothetical protein
MKLTQDILLWILLLSVVFGVFWLGYLDPALRPQVLDFGKVALGGLLGLITAKSTARP